MPKRKPGPKPDRPLTVKEARFVAEYLTGLNAVEACIAAGFSKNRKTAGPYGFRLLQKPRIQKALDAARRKTLAKAELSLDKIVKEMALIGFANMGDYMGVTAAGDPFFDLSKLTREQQAVIAEFTVEDYRDGRTTDAEGNVVLRDVRRIRVKLADKLNALLQLGRHLGGFGSKVELSGPGGGPVNMLVRNFTSLAELDKDERAALRAMLTRRLEQRRGGAEGTGPD